MANIWFKIIDQILQAYMIKLRPGSHELRHSNYCSNSKSYYEIFSTTLDFCKNYHDSFGVTHAQFEL